MRIENEIPQFSDWIGPAFVQWCIAVIVIGVVAGGIWLVSSISRNGLFRGISLFIENAATAAANLFRMSPVRIFTIAWLAVMEALRKKIVVGFAVFIVVLMFAGWFLDPSSPDPAKLYLSFVMTMSSWLVLLMVLFLSVFSLPTDIKNKTIFTVVTKPVHASEIVLGRMLGFTAVGTTFLAATCALSFMFVQFGLSHTHMLTPQDLTEVTEDGSTQVLLQGETRRSSGHAHLVTIDKESGQVVSFGPASKNDLHDHQLVSKTNDQGDTTYSLSNNHGSLLARVPIYGDLAFRSKEGMDKAVGINVGDEWLYRSFIEGASAAAAIWTFDDFTARRFPESKPQFKDGIPVEMTIGVFRSHKGDIEQKIPASLKLRNPDTGLTVEATTFQTEEFATKMVMIPYEFSSDVAQIIQREHQLTEADLAEGSPLAGMGQLGQIVNLPPVIDPTLIAETEMSEQKFDLFEDLVSEDGRIEVWLQCLDSGQYIGAAKADLYIYAANSSVMLNFIKGYFGIWQQMVLVIAYGVVFSTFLSGAVAMVSTVGGIFIAGQYHDKLVEVSSHAMLGGGPVEALWRLLNQVNLVTEMPGGLTTDLIKMADATLERVLQVVTHIVPPLADFNYASFVASGFDVSWNSIAVHGTETCGYLLPLFIVGYLILTNREVAK